MAMIDDTKVKVEFEDMKKLRNTLIYVQQYLYAEDVVASVRGLLQTIESPLRIEVEDRLARIDGLLKDFNWEQTQAQLDETDEEDEPEEDEDDSE